MCVELISIIQLTGESGVSGVLREGGREGRWMEGGRKAKRETKAKKGRGYYEGKKSKEGDKVHVIGGKEGEHSVCEG